MQIKAGCDIVYLPKFTSKFTQNSLLLSKLFTPHELTQSHTLQSLAGKFAAKEAVIKALDLDPGSWLEIEITNTITGKPIVKIAQIHYLLESSEVSISHDGEYAMAVAMFLIRS